jgi:hypothetical protein
MKIPFNPFKTLKPRRPAMSAFKPIRYDQRQVVLMVKVAAFYDPKFAKKVREPRGAALDLLVKLLEGGMPPSPAILRYFDLQREGKAFVWNPR